MVELLAPVRERYAELRPDEAALEAALAAGAEKAREIAAGTVAEVRDRMGIGPRAISWAGDASPSSTSISTSTSSPGPSTC